LEAKDYKIEDDIFNPVSDKKYLQVSHEEIKQEVVEEPLLLSQL